MKIKTSVITALTLSAALTAPLAVSKSLTISLDKSGSNPLLVDPYFAASAAEYAASKVRDLKNGDVVRLRSFGSRKVPQNLLAQDFAISRRLKANQLAESIKAFINDLPSHPEDAQPSTNIIAFLEFDSGLGCEDSGVVLLLTDGLEASDYMAPDDFLSGRKHLPKPDAELQGCEVIFYGLGAGMPGKSAKFIRNEWKKFVSDAGGTFTAEMQ